MELLYTLLILAGIFFGTWVHYLAVMNIKRVRDQGKLYPFAKFCGGVVIALGLPIYISMNLILGTIFFLELPREIRFTKRLQRHKAESKGWRRKLAFFFCEHMLNRIDRDWETQAQ